MIFAAIGGAVALGFAAAGVGCLGLAFLVWLLGGTLPSWVTA